MLPVRNTLQLPPPPPPSSSSSSLARLPGTWNQGILVVRQGGVGSAPATIINGVAALGCGAQYRRLLAVRRTSIVPPCQSFLLPPPIHPSSLLFSFSFFALPPSTIFADIDEPPCALLSSTWTLPDETRLDVFAREIDRLVFHVFPVSLFPPSFLVRFFVSMINFDVNPKRYYSNFNL